MDLRRARERGDCSGGHDNPLNRVLGRVGEEEVARAVARHPTRTIEQADCRAKITWAWNSRRAIEQRADLSRRLGDAPYPSAIGVGDEEVARAVACHPFWSAELSQGPGAVGGATGARAREGVDGSGAEDDLPNLAVELVGDEEVAPAVAGQAHRIVELRGFPRAVGAANGCRSAGKRGDGCRRHDHLSNDVVVGVGDEDAAGPVARQT